MTQYNDLIGELQNKAEDEFGQQKRGVKIRCVDFDNNGPYIFYNENNLDDITIYTYGIASALNFNKLQKYTSNVHQIQETAQNSLTSQAI